MKSCVALLLAILSLPIALLAQAAPPPTPRELRAAWVATVHNIDWPSRKGLAVDQQKRELVAIIERAASLNMNALMLQVRPGSDAVYASSIEPWSEWLTGQQGKAPSPPWDPLAFAVEECHNRGIELHAWVNPYRARVGSGALASNHISVRRPDLVHTYGKDTVLDPGEPDSIKHLHSVIEDIVGRYEVDGVVFDDYFYPGPEAGQEFPDDRAWSAYKAGGGKLGREDWRRFNVDEMVRTTNDLVHRTRPGTRFGVSPFGIWKPGNPAGITGRDTYADLKCDSRKWLMEGWVDYLSPQLYWAIDSEGQSFSKLLGWWAQQNPKGRHMWPSTGLYRLGASAGVSYSVDEIKNQVSIVARTRGAGGVIHYRMTELMDDRMGVATMLKNGQYAKPALPPATTWLDSTPPAAPRVTFDGSMLRWDPAPGGELVTRWVVCLQTAAGWEIDVVPGSERTRRIIGPPPSAMAVKAVDRCGNESVATFAGK